MRRSRSGFRSPEGTARYLAAYDAALTLWSVPYEPVYVDSCWGSTHVLVSGPQDAPPLVLLHGMHLSATMWFPNIAALSRASRVCAVDTIGAAGKSVASRSLRTGTDAADWLCDVLDGLGIVRTDVVGHSYGGWLAINLALAAPARVGRMALLAPAGSLRPLALPFYTRGIPTAILRTRSLVMNYMRWMAAEGFEVNERFAEQFVLGIKHCRTRMMVFPRVFSDDELRSIQSRTLLLIGEKEVNYDPLAAVGRAQRWIRDIQAEIVPGANHGLPMEQPALVSDRILQFLDR